MENVNSVSDHQVLSIVSSGGDAALFVEEQRVWRFMAYSILFHLLMMLLMTLPARFQAPVVENLVEIDMVPTSELMKEESKKKQIAETSLVKKSIDTTPDAFLGAQTQRVAQQTKASVSAPFRSGRIGAAQQNNTSANTVPKSKSAPSLSGLGLPVPILKPLGSLGPVGQMAATSDYLKDIKPGAETMLNTKEFAYFSYYQRVRQQLEQYWEPGLRKNIRKMIDRGRQLASDQEHVTRIQVVLDRMGTITQVKVQSTSGYFDLDQAAVEAFNRAGPFPNPPKGLLEQDGSIRIDWEFVLRT